MIDQNAFFQELDAAGIKFFAGVPDSYLNGFNNYLKTHMDARSHVITANEGNAIALAAGHWFATGELPLVYMQNSGLGNCVNPLLSLTDRQVFAVPLVLLIGWRGEPGTADGRREQHIAQGRLTKPLLEELEIPYHVLGEDTFPADIRWAADLARQTRAAVALIAPGKTMTEKKKNEPDESYPLSREEAIRLILEQLPRDTVYGATTGRATRELYCQRELRGEGHEKDYLNLGAMGHNSSVMMGMALAQPGRKFVALDGDAAALMHLGAMAIGGSLPIPNYIHVILNNGAHESVGGQPSVGHRVDFTTIAQGCGYFTVGHPVRNGKELTEALEACAGCGGPSFIDVRIHSGLRPDLGAITLGSRELIQQLINELR